MKSGNTGIKSGLAAVATASDYSAIIDLGSTIERRVRVHRAAPNTNLIAPETVVPQLFGALPAGVTVLICAVIAAGDTAAVRAALGNLPPKPDIAELQDLVARKGVDVMPRASR